MILIVLVTLYTHLNNVSNACPSKLVYTKNRLKNISIYIRKALYKQRCGRKESSFKVINFVTFLLFLYLNALPYFHLIYAFQQPFLQIILLVI
jgi:hypothetical protein